MYARRTGGSGAGLPGAIPASIHSAGQHPGRYRLGCTADEPADALRAPLAGVGVRVIRWRGAITKIIVLSVSSSQVVAQAVRSQGHSGRSDRRRSGRGVTKA